jgi:hypothetical protein
MSSMVQSSAQLQGVQSCGAVAGDIEPACLSLLLLLEQWELWDLLTQGHWFLWCFRAKVAGPVLVGSMEF